MFAKVLKRSALFEIDRIFNFEFYSAAYAPELAGGDPKKHFVKHFRSSRFDPAPDISLSKIASRHSDMSASELLDKLCSDTSFYNSNRGVSPSVFRYFGIKHNDYLVQCCELILSEFDEEYYLSENPDVARTWIPPHVHYTLFGAYEGRSPNSYFNSRFYLEENPDVLELNLNPLAHYIEFGRAEGRFPSDVEKARCQESQESELDWLEKTIIDGEFYLDSNPDVKNLGLDPVAHYCEFGEREGRMPNRYFDPVYYRDKYEDVGKSGLSPLDHYREIGFAEGREAIAKQEVPGDSSSGDQADSEPAEIVFDSEFYLESNPDVRAAGVDPCEHYMASGEREWRKPNKYFCPSFYLAINADVRSLNISPFEHYRVAGFWEGRLGRAPVKKERSSTKKPVLFVGHDGIQAGSEIVLLEVIKWFYNHTNRRIKVLLLSPGPVANQYALYADVFVLPDYRVDDKGQLQKFIGEDFELLYVNTVVSGRFFSLLGECGLYVTGDVIAHVHEMEKVIEENIDSFQQLKPYVKHWVSASPASTATLQAKYAIDASDITTVPAFIKPVVEKEVSSAELKDRVRRELGLSSTAVIIAGCGTVYWRKGPDIFVNVARRILKDSNAECQFLWIGDGPDLEKIVGSLSAEEQACIRFIGPRTDANRLLAAADIFFLSSREDPFPLVVMEAAQHEIPTVCFSEATGITDFVLNDAGVPIEYIDESLAVSAIKTLVNDRKFREQLGRQAKVRLFEKYTAEKQCLNIYSAIAQYSSYVPSISVVVPFYNHERFAVERIESILKQSIKDVEIILMDDCSSDNTAGVVEKFTSDPRITVNHNGVNSGSPFKQWQKGVSLSSSELLWIAEGDDTCSANFLEVLLPYFDDPMMSVAYAKTEIINEEGELKEGALDPYLNGAYPGKFDKSYVKDGFAEVEEQLGAVCTLVNASGLLMRKSMLQDEILLEAGNFKMCGDWYVYLSTLKGGKIAYDVQAKNYFRRHSSSAVHNIEGTKTYFYERVKVARYVFENFPLSRRAINRVIAAIDGEWQRFKFKHEGVQKEQIFDRKVLVQYAQSKVQKPHVALYVHGMTFSKGGIERLAAELSNKMVENGYRVTIYCRSWGGDRPVYPIYESVDLKPIFNEHKQEESIVGLRSDLFLSGVDIFMPMLSEWLFEPIVAAAHGTGIPIIVSEHNDPAKIVELWWDEERRLETFSKADGIHLILDKFTESLPSNLKEKAVVIPNFVSSTRMADEGEVYARERHKVVIAVGRLSPQKRMDRLVDAFSLIADRYPDWQVHIYGDGELKEDLMEQIQQKGLSGQVILKGKTDDITKCYQSSSIFVIPSEFEAFGIVVAEAQQQSLPAIGFKQCNGPNVLIEHETSGLLVDDSDEAVVPARLAEALELLICDPELREKYGSQGKLTANEYELSKVFPKWEGLFAEYC